MSSDENKDFEPDEEKLLKTVFKWPIRLGWIDGRYDFKDSGDPIESGIFSSSNNNDFKWKLKLYPNGENDECRDYISIYLHLESSDIPHMIVFYEVSLLDWNRKKVHKKVSTFDNTMGVGGLPKFIERKLIYDPLSSLMYLGALTIHCRIYTLLKGANIRNPETKVIEDLTALIDNQKLADVTLVASNGELRAHKAILAARSPVFARMFESDMLEKQENVVRIGDMKLEVLEELLRYVYSGKMKNPDKNAWDLIAAADKYQMDEMKTDCEKVLLKNLKTSNAVKTLVLADRFNLARVKPKVIDFVNVHASLVIETQGFKSLAKEEAHLIVEAYCVLANAVKAKKNKRCKVAKVKRPSPRSRRFAIRRSHWRR